jgi:hypothetical protein
LSGSISAAHEWVQQGNFRVAEVAHVAVDHGELMHLGDGGNHRVFLEGFGLSVHQLSPAAVCRAIHGQYLLLEAGPGGSLQTVPRLNFNLHAGAMIMRDAQQAATHLARNLFAEHAFVSLEDPDRGAASSTIASSVSSNFALREAASYSTSARWPALAAFPMSRPASGSRCWRPVIWCCACRRITAILASGWSKLQSSIFWMWPSPPGYWESGIAMRSASIPSGGPVRNPSGVITLASKLICCLRTALHCRPLNASRAAPSAAIGCVAWIIYGGAESYERQGAAVLSWRSLASLWPHVDRQGAVAVELNGQRYEREQRMLPMRKEDEQRR